MELPKILDSPVEITDGVHSVNAPIESSQTSIHTGVVTCLQSKARSPPPAAPKRLPFAPDASNIPKLKQYLLNAFDSSTFNKSHPFPKLSTPPAHIHLRPDATPCACFTPAVVPHHWEESVKAALDADVAADVIRKVPIGEPSEWCARMVVVAKKDGRPRRCIDFQKLNAQCLREPYHTRSPFRTACRIPPSTYKSVVDAVDGFHSVELDNVSSRLTTFITPWGRYRYNRFPQGHSAAGDAFNSRFHKIMQHVPRMERIVDDMCLYDHSISEAFYHVWDVLFICANNGIVLNRNKFQFCQESVDFAGLTITMDGIQPSSKMLAAIQDFPPPTNLKSARAWFGLSNEVQWAYANSHVMAPFCDLISTKSRFYWNDRDHLAALFDEAKQQILQQVREGVRTFDISKYTCLQTDWFKESLGYLLLQKKCTLSSGLGSCLLSK